MSSIVEVTGKTYKVLADAENKTWHKVSFWTKAVDVFTSGNYSLETILNGIAGPPSDAIDNNTSTLLATSKAVYKTNSKLPKILTLNQAAGSTVWRFTNSFIKEDSMVDVYSSIFGVSPVGMSISDGEVALTFDQQKTAMTVQIKVTNNVEV